MAMTTIDFDTLLETIKAYLTVCHSQWNYLKYTEHRLKNWPMKMMKSTLWQCTRWMIFQINWVYYTNPDIKMKGLTNVMPLDIKKNFSKWCIWRNCSLLPIPSLSHHREPSFQEKWAIMRENSRTWNWSRHEAF